MHTSIVKRLAPWAIVVFALFSAMPSTAENETAATVYGALYQAGNLEAEEGSNTEIVLAYYPGELGFIALTANDAGVEWWTSDKFGMEWERVEDNPLEEYTCKQAGRHSSIIYNGDYYFGALCDVQGKAQAHIFKITGKDSVELIHQKPDTQTPVVQADDPTQPVAATQYPTAAVLNNELYMFYNGGFTVCDETTCEDISSAVGQPIDGVPLEASEEDDGKIYLAFTSGEVMSFDGEVYTTIGENIVDSSEGEGQSLPAIAFYDNTVYVGNSASPDQGATLFRYDSEDKDDDDDLWEEVVTLPAGDGVINKMDISGDIEGKSYLVFFTGNDKTGSRVLGVDPSGEVIELIDAGLGGKNPENNKDVVSVINRTVEDNDIKKKVMVFGTQNTEDQAKIFVLNLDDDLAYTPTENDIISTPPEEVTPPVEEEESEEDTTSSMRAKSKKNSGETAFGEVFKLQVPKKEVQKADVYVLYINGKAVDVAIASKNKAKVVLEYKKAKSFKVGKTFKVTVGVQRSYANGDTVSTNTIIGETLKVTAAQ